MYENSTNVLYFRNCRAYREPMTSHALGRLTGSRTTLRADVIVAILEAWRHVKNPTHVHYNYHQFPRIFQKLKKFLVDRLSDVIE